MLNTMWRCNKKQRLFWRSQAHLTAIVGKAFKMVGEMAFSKRNIVRNYYTYCNAIAAHFDNECSLMLSPSISPSLSPSFQSSLFHCQSLLIFLSLRLPSLDSALAREVELWISLA